MPRSEKPTTYCRLSPAELVAYAELLETQKVHVAPHPQDQLKRGEHPKTIVSVSGFTIPCSSAVTAARLKNDLEAALGPILQRHAKRLRRETRKLL